MTEETADGEEGGWIPWKEAADKEGEECLLEMVKGGTVTTRRHVKLPLNSNIPWPRNQQVKYEREVWSRKRKTEDQHVHHKKEEATESAVQAHHTTYEEQVRSAGKKAQKTDEQQLNGIIPGPPNEPHRAT